MNNNFRFPHSPITEPELSPDQERKIKKTENKARYGRYWLVYGALAITAMLSITAGILLPLRPDEAGQVHVTLPVILACIFYAVGFLMTGEGASLYWFGKMTDHDQDNTTQQVVAWSMMALSIITSLTTAMAAGTFIAYLLGALTVFDVMPMWAQNWVVYAIPIMLTIHAVCGMVFKAVSDEAMADRKGKAAVRQVLNEAAQVKAEAYASYVREHAPEQARQLGEMEAKKTLADYAIRLGAAPATQTALDVRDHTQTPETKREAPPLPRPRQD